MADSNQDLSNKEEIAFQQQLVNLKYSTIKSIQVDGDIYDCIDFFKQLGFNHPFWKNTTIQVLKIINTLHIGLKDGGCPYGMVPIKRIDENDLEIAKTNSKIYLSNIEEEPGHQDYISTGPNSKDSVWTLLFKEESAIVGFWPSTVFGKLSEFGNEANWGGEVYSPLDQPSPAMGTCILPLRDNFSSIWSAHSTHIAVAYENSQSKFVNPSDAEVYESDPESYNIVDAGYWSEAEFGRAIVYDGPGGIKST
ncbi:hypothetical protein I3843_12G126500 [Carya illinoinensis]|uniref:Neprosin PEP catalytic domain-containing protein n=1 Tax=Carya illinoinensis TaxID=32201 RepID=A0A922IY00_CARIL|nr:hypothetical protein I3842_12G126300 [Carya illinoinensis]KAG7953767.1 hypothetical protein I3843_12G126500 [Carya illinoinensis]